MFKFITQRFLLLIPTLLGVITLVFFMIALSPGDPARIMLGERASVERVEKLRNELGLNKPLGVQYLLYLKRVVQFDLGNSIRSGLPVVKDIAARLPATIELALSAMIYSTVLGLLLGVWAARKKNTLIDYGSMISSLIGVSMPIFWLGLVLIMIFSINLDLLPTGSRMSAREAFDPITGFYVLDSLIYLFKTGDGRLLKQALSHLVLPTIALGSIPLAVIARTTRSSMLEVLKQDYIKTARAAGMPERIVLYHYALKNALLPIVTVIGLQFGLLLSGAILTERIFAWPGIGIWLYKSIESRDFTAVQGGIIFVAMAFVLVNAVVDILYCFIDPKIRMN